MKKLVVIAMSLGAAAVPATSAQAATTVQKDIPFSAVIEGCGNTITLSGTLIGIFTEQPLANGGLLVTSHFQPHGLSGTSSTGVPYHGTGLTRETTVFIPAGGLVDTSINRFHIVGTRGAPTYYVKETEHLTVTPAGNVSVSFDNFSLECK